MLKKTKTATKRCVAIKFPIHRRKVFQLSSYVTDNSFGWKLFILRNVAWECVARCLTNAWLIFLNFAQYFEMATGRERFGHGGKRENSGRKKMDPANRKDRTEWLKRYKRFYFMRGWQRLNPVICTGISTTVSHEFAFNPVYTIYFKIYALICYTANEIFSNRTPRKGFGKYKISAKGQLNSRRCSIQGICSSWAYTSSLKQGIGNNTDLILFQKLFCWMCFYLTLNNIKLIALV